MSRGISILLIALLAGCAAVPAADSPDSEPSPPPPSTEAPASSSPEPSPSASALPSAEPSESPAAAPVPLAVDGLAQTTVEGLRLREEPGLAGQSLGTLAIGSSSFVVSGPVSADGYDWYLLSGLGLPQASGCTTPIETDPFACPTWFGWAATDGADGDSWLVPTQPDCPPWPSAGLTDDFVYSVQTYTYLACYGGTDHAVAGYYPEIPEDAGLGGACPDVPSELSWIGCNLGYEHIVLDPATGFFGPGLVLAIDPASGVVMPARGQSVEVTGRFDHPAAQSCTFGDAPEASVLACRAQFVVESARAVSSP
ncbi:MAG: hypothetical protein ACRDGV_06635 [Candidatus Limnocylindria bacterium]